jgi:hypothetical protein
MKNSTFNYSDTRLRNIERGFEEKTCVQLNRRAAKRRSLPRSAGIVFAAVLLVSSLSIGALAANLFGLRDMVVTSVTFAAKDGGAADYQDGDRHDIISLQGYSDSPEYKAFAEWTEFRSSYDPDLSILSKIGNSDTGLDMTYKIYGCYTPEMADKLDEITAKYKLSLLGKVKTFDNAHTDDFINSIAYGDFLGETNTALPGYLYECGTFKFEGFMADYETVYAGSLGDETVVIYEDDFESTEKYMAAAAALSPPAELPISFSFSHSVKGTLDFATASIGKIEDYTSWSYKTACGLTVSLSQSESRSILTLDIGKAFVTVFVLEGTDGLTARDLEAFADSIDFTLLK